MSFHKVSEKYFNPSSTNPTHTQKPANCLSILDHFAGLVLKGLRQGSRYEALEMDSYTSYCEKIIVFEPLIEYICIIYRWKDK